MELNLPSWDECRQKPKHYTSTPGEKMNKLETVLEGREDPWKMEQVLTFLYLWKCTNAEDPEVIKKHDGILREQQLQGKD